MLFIENKDGLSIPIPPTFKKYSVKKQLGQGNFGSVFKVEEKESGKYYAAKIFPMVDETKNIRLKENITNEYEILSLIDHPNIIKFYEAFEIKNDQNQDLFVLILEYCHNGSMLEYINNKRFKNKNEKKKMMRSLVETIIYLQEMRIAHCDIKLENILIDEKILIYKI